MTSASTPVRLPKYRRHKPRGQAVVTLSGKTATSASTATLLVAATFGQSPCHVSETANRIRRVFRWDVVEGPVPVAVLKTQRNLPSAAK